MKFEVLVEIKLWVRFVVLDSIFRMSDESGLNWSIRIEDWMNVWEMKPVVLLELELNVMIVIEIVLVWCLLWIEVY